MKPPCSECGAPYYCKGLCRLHYDRARFQRTPPGKPKQIHDGRPRRRTQVWLPEDLFRDLVMETVKHEGRKVAETVRLAVSEYLQRRVSAGGENAEGTR